MHPHYHVLGNPVSWLVYMLFIILGFIITLRLTLTLWSKPQRNQGCFFALGYWLVTIAVTFIFVFFFILLAGETCSRFGFS